MIPTLFEIRSGLRRILPYARGAVMLFLVYHFTLGGASTNDLETDTFAELRLPATAPLDITSHAGDATVAVDHMGVVVLDERGLRLQVNRSRARIHPAFDLRLQVVGVGFGIAKHSPAGFEIVDEHVIPQSGGWDRGANADVAIGYPEFRIDGVVPADLVNRWPVLFLEVRMRDREYHGGRVVYGEPGQVMRLYAHGSDEIFRGLLAGKPWQ